MPLLKRKRESDRLPQRGSAPSTLAVIPADQVGAFLCGERTCPERAEVACRYVDRAGRACLTAWCAKHHEVVDEVPYCRRHAGVMSALGAGTEVGAPLPDVDNRTPSLMHWVVRGLDADLTTLLEGMADPQKGERVVTEGVQERPGRKREPTRWASSWMLCDNSAVSLRVTVEITESSDPEVVVRVGRDVVASQVPPWITRRARGLALIVDAETEARERRDFFRSLHNSIAEAAARRRTRG
jgi:hypothetical protein